MKLVTCCANSTTSTKHNRLRHEKAPVIVAHTQSTEQTTGCDTAKKKKLFPRFSLLFPFTDPSTGGGRRTGTRRLLEAASGNFLHKDRNCALAVTTEVIVSCATAYVTSSTNLEQSPYFFTFSRPKIERGRQHTSKYVGVL